MFRLTGIKPAEPSSVLLDIRDHESRHELNSAVELHERIHHDPFQQGHDWLRIHDSPSLKKIAHRIEPSP
ncbi:hypothetical protein CLOP_g10532 [Closterium sp. NIES-67]|nr:hypothetical protein CLOP_g10532 [Closterium sp. NIES-67]